jgi:hypothetical protein
MRQNEVFEERERQRKAEIERIQFPVRSRREKSAETSQSYSGIHSSPDVCFPSTQRSAGLPVGSSFFGRNYDEAEAENSQDELDKFPSHIRSPPSASKDNNKKLKYTVWVRDMDPRDYFGHHKVFDSSFDTVEDANLRVNYLFYQDNPWGLSSYDADRAEKIELEGGLKCLKYNSGYRSGALTIAALRSDVYEILVAIDSGKGSRYFETWMGEQSEFSDNVRNPSPQNLQVDKRLEYTVWTSCGYDNDGWHSYDGPPDKEFNSSFCTLKEANERAEYVFLYKNPWGLIEEDERPRPEKDTITDKGFRYLECRPDDSERWKVSVIPSYAFDYINV